MVQRLIVLCSAVFLLFLLYLCLDDMWLFRKAQERGQSIGDALSDSSEKKNSETISKSTVTEL